MRFLFRFLWVGLLWLKKPLWSPARIARLCRGGQEAPPSLPSGYDEHDAVAGRPPPPRPPDQEYYRRPQNDYSEQHVNSIQQDVPPQFAPDDNRYFDGQGGEPQLPDSYEGEMNNAPLLPGPEQPFEPVPEEDALIKDSSGLDLSNMDNDYVLKGVAKLYRKKMLPLELASKFALFQSPPLSPSDFEAPPMVLLLGQYSVGKTSFIKYLLGRDFPGIRVGPEPTTDRFTAVLYGERDKIVPGAALSSQTHRQFTGLGPFGNNFLSRMEGVELDSPILRDVTLVDTPGILSGHKQRSRSYDYEGVMKWFAERADLIIVMFDAHKLDISDELQSVMELMIPHLDKLRIVLNKADSISTQQLMRVYGALMWSLGKVMNTPEVCRVYMGSFWDQPMQNAEQAELLEREERDLLRDIQKLPQQAVLRKINDLVKRYRSVKVHAYIIHYLRKQLPYTWGKREKQKRLVGRLDREMMAAARRYGLARGDFPPVRPMQLALSEIKDLSEFPKLDKKLIKEMDRVFAVDIPRLLEHAQRHNKTSEADDRTL